MAEFIRKRGRGKITPGRVLRQLARNESAKHTRNMINVADVENAAKFKTYTEIEETPQDHIIPRQSLTARLHLGTSVTEEIQTEPRISRQMDQRHYRETGEIKLVITTDEVVISRRESTLLDSSRPASTKTFKRRTHRSKRIKTLHNEFDPVVEEYRTGTDPKLGIG